MLSDKENMKIVGLTGGIGSGKSTVAAVFQKLGVGVYIADTEAKRLMHEDVTLKKAIVRLFGNEAYIDGKLNRSWISSQVFSDKALLEKLTQLVHPVVSEDFAHWTSKQTGTYVIKEAAILFENEGYKHCDYTILVIAPKEERITRVMQRDQVIREHVLERMQHQWEDDQKIPLADFVLSNTNFQQLPELVEEIHQKISRLS